MICNTPQALFTSGNPLDSSPKTTAGVRFLLALGAIEFLSGCGPRAATADWAVPAVLVSAPAVPGSRYPSLAPRPDGGAVLSWVAPAADGEHALQ
jgi:hypothetical protein